MKIHALVWTTAVLILAVNASAQASDRDTLAPYRAPVVLSEDHREMHEFLLGVTREPGQIGEAARALALVMDPHFEKEEAFILPPLALLPMLARGETYQDMREILPLTDRLAEELPVMLEEHKVIGEAARELLAIARAEGRYDVERLAEQVLRHAETEEQIMYPAAILVGKMVESRLGRRVWYPDTR